MSVVKEAAQKAGVSISTVSLVLNNKPGISGKTRERVFESLQALGYTDYLPRKVSKNKQQNIQFVLYKKHGQVVADTPFFSYVLEGVEEEVRKHGYSLSVTYFYETQEFEEQIQNILAVGSAGLVLLATEMTHKDIDIFKRLKIPFVVLDSYFEEISEDTVVINNMQGAFLATRALCEKGHTAIGYLRSKVLINNFYERKDGFKKALKYCKVPYNKDYVFSVGPSVETAHADMLALLKKNPQLPTAFFADNDVIAIGAMRAMREVGIRIPQDVSVIGFDDIPMCEMLESPLTTICVPKKAIGQLAVRRLAEIIKNGRDALVKIEVSTELVERSSVRAI
jgi:LacI family transcriptional regulator